MGRGLERRHLTQTGDHDGDPECLLTTAVVDYGYLSGDSTPLRVAKDRRGAGVSTKGGGDLHAARLLAKWIDGLGCQEVAIRTDGWPGICEMVRRVPELRAEGTTTVDEIRPG